MCAHIKLQILNHISSQELRIKDCAPKLFFYFTVLCSNHHHLIYTNKLGFYAILTTIKSGLCAFTALPEPGEVPAT